MPVSPLLTVEDLAKFLHKSVTSIRSDATRNPQSLPPICRLPGTKRLLWRLEDVQQWLADHVANIAPPAAVSLKKAPIGARGRPTKAQQVTRQRKQVLTPAESGALIFEGAE